MSTLTLEEKELLAEENYNLIHHFAQKYYSPKFNYDDIFGAASMGMTKALNTYDSNKKVKFVTYAARCIINEIFQFMRRERKHLNNVSIDQPITTDEKGNDLTILDVISTQERELDWREISPIVNQVLKGLSERDRKIMLMFFENKTQGEISELLGISQAQVSRIIRKVLEKIKKEYWRGEMDMPRVPILTAEEYQELREQGKTDTEIAVMKNTSPAYIYQLKKKWFKDENKPADNEKETQAIETPKEDKAAEYERLMAELQNELASLREENDNLIKQTHEDSYMIENMKKNIENLDKTLRRYEEENKALRQLVALWI